VEDASGEPTTGTARLGIYSDSDQTQVLRAMAAVGKTWGSWNASANATVDAVSSASIDVRSSPLGKVDVTTGASGRVSTSGGQMSDQRFQGVVGGGWKDSDGHAISGTTAIATERDYASVSGGLSGSLDVLERNATLLGGFAVTDNWVSSVLDPMLHRKMVSLSWSAGAARVLTRDDAIRLRYDGKISVGYLASPYRYVRFGDWTTTTTTGGQLVFGNTIGSADGLPEKLPESRIGHALAFEWVHSLGPGIGLHPAVRVGYDSWGVASLTPSVDLRIARPSWRAQVGYRFYAQSSASFFEGKYTQDPSMYTSYTSDKELGGEIGHLGTFDVARVVREARNPSHARLLAFLHVDVFSYAYRGFVLLSSRDSEFIELGLSWEP
jgi:hypothetical protein